MAIHSLNTAIAIVSFLSYILLQARVSGEQLIQQSQLVDNEIEGGSIISRGSHLHLFFLA
jgi:hypothetical protein